MKTLIIKKFGILMVRKILLQVVENKLQIFIVNYTRDLVLVK
jgi:hypothetical protein